MAIIACIFGSVLGIIGAFIGLFGFGFSLWDAVGFYFAASMISVLVPLIWAVAVSHSPRMSAETSELL